MRRACDLQIRDSLRLAAAAATVRAIWSLQILGPAPAAVVKVNNRYPLPHHGGGTEQRHRCGSCWQPLCKEFAQQRREPRACISLPTATCMD